MVNVEAPEMLAAIERGDIDGFAVWEPWPTRTLMAVKGTKVLQTAEGIYNNINFVYMNRGWIEQNKATAEKFMLSLMQANDLIEKDRPAAAKMVAKFLKMPLELATELMPKVEFDMDWQPRSLEAIQVAEKQLADQKKLKAPLDYSKYVYMDLLKAVRPENVKITALPKNERSRHPEAERRDPCSAAMEKGPSATLGATVRSAGSACRSSRRAPASGRSRRRAGNPAPPH